MFGRDFKFPKVVLTNVRFTQVLLLTVMLTKEELKMVTLTSIVPFRVTFR